MIFVEYGLNKPNSTIKIYINDIKVKRPMNILSNDSFFFNPNEIILLIMKMPTYDIIIIQINQNATPKVPDVPKNMSIALLRWNPFVMYIDE